MSKKVIAFMMLSLLWVPVATAQIDAMELALQQPYRNKQPLRWDNIGAGPFWLNDKAPVYYPQWKMQGIRTQPGQLSRFHLPAYESLRLYNPGRRLSTKGIAVYLSNGTGLLAETKVRLSTDRHSLVISPQSANPLIVHVGSSAQQTVGTELAVMVSRRERLNTVAPYRNLKGLSGKWAWLSDNPLQIPEVYWQMQAHQKEVVEIEGPARIVLKNRLRYETQATELIQDYRVRYRLNDRPPVWLDFATGIESGRIISVNTMKETLGREQRAYIEIPTGHHRLQLMSDRGLYLRVLEQGEDDYLLPILNQPPLAVQSIRKQGLMAHQELPVINALAQDMVRDNSSKSAPLLGQQLLKDAALRRLNYSAGLSEAKKLLRQHSFYRNLLPGVKNSLEDQFNAYFVNKQLRAIRRPQHDPVVAGQHRSAALNQLGNAYFSPAGTDSENYPLSERDAPTLLRVITDKRQCQERRFSIQMDQEPPQSFRLLCQNDDNADQDFVLSLSETALLDLAKQTTITDNITLGHSFAAYRRPAEMIPVAVNEIVLPQKIRRLKVWCDDNAQRPLNLALQIRAAKPYQFSEQSYSARVRDSPKSQLFDLLVEDLRRDRFSSSHTERQLQNEWIPLKRFITGLHRHYRSTVADTIPVKYLAEQSQLQNWRIRAQRAEQRQQWTEALEHWARVVEGSQGVVRDQAQLAQAALLARLSENYLAQSLWRYLALYAQPRVAKQAETQLLAIYRRQHNSAAIQMLAATMFMQRPDQKRLKFLIEALMENQQYRFALLLGLIVADPPLELMLKAAYQLNWWQNYQQWLTELPESRQGFWKGLKAQKLGNYQTALDTWQRARAESWVQQLRQALQIRKQLSESSNIGFLYRNWSQWQQRHPGGSLWKDAARLVKDTAGTDQYYVLERDLYSKAFRGSTQRPIKLRVMGPVRLSFKIRVLHDRADSQLDGWLRIHDNQDQYRYPFSNNKPVQGMELTGEGNYLPGNLMALEYQVGEGVHEIELSSDDALVSVVVHEQRPELPLTVLAPLQLDTFSHALAAVMPVNENPLIEQIPVKPSASQAIAEGDFTLQDLQQLPKVNDAGQAEVRMAHYVAVSERQKEDRAGVLVVAEQLQQQFPEQEIIQALWRRMSRYSQWQSANSIVGSAGIRFVDTQGWQPVSPVLNIRKALISKTKPDEHVVYSDQRLVMVMTNLVARTVHVEALLDDVAFLPASAGQLRYQIDEREPQSLAIAHSDGWKKLFLRVPAGHHQIRFSVVKPVANQFLKLRFQDHAFNMQVSQERPFFVSTRKDPLRLYVKGPASVRIEEWLSGKIAARYENVAPGWQLLTIPPGDKQQESLLQVRQRVPTDAAKPAIPRIVKRKLKIVTAPAVAVPVKDFQVPEFIKIEDYFKLGRQEDGSWSLSTDLVRRNNVQEDSDLGDPEQFLQFEINHRYFDEFRNAYWNTRGFARTREHGGPTLAVSESVYMKPDDFPFTLNFEAKIVSQVVHKDPEWLGQFKIAISQTAQITPKSSVLPKLSWFGRYLSARDNNKLNNDPGTEDLTFKRKIDQDVFTRYKAQHTSGLSASLLFTHDPWLDTRWTAKIKTVSNENMNFFNPDHFATEAHWKQLLGDVSLDAGYRISFYQKDNDRTSSVKRHFTKLELTWQSWTHKLNRLEIGGRYNYDIDKKEHLGLLSFSYHFGEGRGYRDFKPGEIDFRHIRKRQRMDEYN